jgi:hypothetical protein
MWWNANMKNAEKKNSPGLPYIPIIIGTWHRKKEILTALATEPIIGIKHFLPENDIDFINTLTVNGCKFMYIILIKDGSMANLIYRTESPPPRPSPPAAVKVIEGSGLLLGACVRVVQPCLINTNNDKTTWSTPLFSGYFKNIRCLVYFVFALISWLKNYLYFKSFTS